MKWLALLLLCACADGADAVDAGTDAGFGFDASCADGGEVNIIPFVSDGAVTGPPAVLCVPEGARPYCLRCDDGRMECCIVPPGYPACVGLCE